MTVPDVTTLTDALIRELAPVTRTLYRPGETPVKVNTNGVDIYDGHVPTVPLDADGTAHAYAVIWDSPGRLAHTRAVAKASLNRWAPQVTVAGGSPRKLRWGLDRVRPVLDGARLTTETGAPLTGPLVEQLDAIRPQRDEDVSPPRWYVPIQYATTAH